MMKLNDSEEVNLVPYETSKPVFYMPPRSLEYGLYQVTVTVNFSGMLFNYNNI